jgi:hypothetical protein
MSKPDAQQRELDELELDAQTIEDLEVDENDADGVRGGARDNTDCTLARSGC